MCQDDKVSMDFVVAAANLRAHVFGIQRKSRFDIKCEIVHDIIFVFIIIPLLLCSHGRKYNPCNSHY